MIDIRHDPTDLDRCLADWARLGVGFAVAASGQTPDLERLIVRTIQHGRSHARLLIMAATWLSRHGAAVARHRLATIARAELGSTELAILGLLLTSIDATGNGCRRFREALVVCAPIQRPQPLFMAHARHPTLRDRLDRRASALSRRWGVLAEAFELKYDALRPTRWILERNPEFVMRSDLGGDLRCSILVELANDPGAGASELELARRCGASRIAVRNALDRLELAGHVVRPTRAQSGGRCRPVRRVA